MKKGEIYEGIIEKIDFPNKGRIRVENEIVTVKNGRNVLEELKADCWRFWRSLHWKPESQCVNHFLPAAAVCIRQCLMKNS